MNIDKAYTIARSALASAEDAQEIVIAANLRQLCDMLEIEIRATAARSAKVQNRQRAALRILKNAEKSTSSDFFHKAWRDTEGRQFVCDGYQAVALNTPLPLPEGSNNMPNIENAILAARRVKTPLDLAYSLAELKGLKAIHDAEQKRYAAKTRKPGYFTFGENAPDVNIDYLINTLEILPNAQLSYSEQQGKNSPVYLGSPDGCGIIMPSNVTSGNYVNA